MIDMTSLMTGWLLALLRFTPLLLMPALTPFSWAPLHVRMMLLIALSWLAVGVMPQAPESSHLLLASGCSELLIGGCYSMAVMLPMAALGLPARLLDVQAGLASASLFNPSVQSTDSLLGTLLSLAGTLVFFALGFHLLVLRSLMASARLVPLGALAHAPHLSALLGMLGSQFVLGLMVVLPVVLGLFVIDLVIAFASRSMPQANIYFLALPLKVVAVLALLAGSLRLAPTLMSRLFTDALVGSQAMVKG
ncbi:flagellar biosynthetic protein FliR [Dyella silvatica]|uniref:flagellar biosynthetic protein FliR n=1 Tax=Dyella silvatica TaxID=2992128 RepID=UPI002255E21C|nr:flagellar biosynthetic protein FliR [Dyella silvatica]